MAPKNPQTKTSKAAFTLALWAGLAVGAALTAPTAQALNLANNPLFVTETQPPAVMLTMGKDHKLYYEAYNDYSDLDGDGTLDVGYKPASIDYYGYFDSYKCYTYSSGVFTPAGASKSKSNKNNKKCSGQWSGDFLNYVTMSRMDALRKVFYGGYRSTDTSTQTILERVFIPQDAHSWGKEYQSISRDGYDIREYTPLDLPATNRYHLLANLTLTGVGNPPLMRVLENSQFRVWEWLSIERPVGGDDCATGNNSRSNCVTASTTTGSTWQVVPSSVFKNLQIATYSHTNNGYPGSHADFETWKTNYAIAANSFGQSPLSTINCDTGTGAKCNPNSSTQQEHYLTIITGQITIPSDGSYSFAVDGDDAVEVIVDGTVVASYYGGHSFCNCDTNNGSKNLTAGDHTIEFRHEETAGGDGYRLKWQSGAVTAKRTDYTVRVEVCNASIGLESNCTGYGSTSTNYKPTGILQNYGATNSMYFGLLTGSYAANTDGGILRKNIEPDSINSELNADGSFKTSVNGIISTLNKLRIAGFRYSSQDYEGTEGGTRYYNCGWITTRQMNPGECQMWGNPLGEMVYEAVRYFSGKTSPTSSFVANPSGNANADDFLGLPKPAWKDPYVATASGGGGLPHCAKPYVMAISDVYPSFDSESVPGTAFGTFTNDISAVTGVRTDINVQTLGQKIWDTEFGASKSVFMGQTTASNFDSAPTAKTATTFGTLRGLAPGEPTRQGSYSAAEIAYWGHVNNLSGAASTDRNLNFYSIALASPLPKIQIPVGSSTVTIVPFAKSVGGSSISATQGDFQPTNQIVDFYVEKIVNVPGSATDSTENGGRAKYVFRINYEDVEQGADHDMDAIVTYTVLLNADNTIKITQSSDYAAGGIIQHMGYVISGTTADGIYLNVRDADTTSGDPDYFLDTPRHPSGLLDIWNERNFTPSTSSTSALLLNDPLWYAAKWGSFKLPVDAEGNEVKHDGDLRTPVDATTWDSDGNGVPDNYFLVVNPLQLEDQLKKALDKILGETGTAAALATNSSAWKQGAKLYQAKFSGDGWFGEIASKTINSDGSTTTTSDDWRAELKLAALGPAARNIITYDGSQAIGSRGIAFTTLTTLPTAMQTSLNNNAAGTADGKGADRLSYLRGTHVAGSGMRDRPMIRDENGNSTSQINLLGDIVDSAIQFVGIPDFGYADPSYAAYRTANGSRDAMLYVGSNDGFLHGFKASDGVEKFAYIPSILFRGNKLSKLTQDDYGKASNGHAYYVDGTPTVADVCTVCGTSGCSGNICPLPGTGTNWKTILVGGLNGGGQSIYAMNISDPSTFSSSSAALPMWEFSDFNDTDTDADMRYGLGFTYSRPAVVKVCTSRDSSSTSVPKACLSSRWAVVMGNGHNNATADGYASTSGHAILYVLDALDGSRIKKINTKTGSTASPNGLPNVAVADVDGDGVADYVYAGDLRGNMWKFDLTANAAADWAVAYDSSGTPLPLYIAKDGSSNVQPITTAPELLAHPNGGVVVLFGTGLYLQESDKTNTATQSFYGIWDNGASLSANTRANLQQQSIIAASSQEGFQTSTHNTVDWATKKGWYMDLPNSGERVAFDPTLFRKIIYFTSLQPDTDICKFGGESWDTFLDGLTGQALDTPVFTAAQTAITGTGITGTSYASRRASKVGITPQGTTIDFGQGTTQMYKGGSKQGNIENFGLKLGSGSARREAWREIIKD
jgi:type IV pilus assembly protein PilY1